MENQRPTQYAVRVELNRAVFGITVNADGSIDWAASAAYGVAAMKRAGIRTGREAVKHFRAQGGSVTWEPLDEVAG